MADVEGFQNYLRLTLLLNEATLTLQQEFRINYKQLSGGSDWKDGPTCGKAFLRTTVGQKYFNQAQKIQKNLLKKGKLNEWDLTMLCNIFLMTNWKIPSALQTQTIQLRNSLLLQLRDMRNQLAHLADFKTCHAVSSSQFPSLWTTLSTTVIQIGGDSSLIKDIESAKHIGGIKFENPTSTLSTKNESRVRTISQEGQDLLSDGKEDLAIEKFTRALNVFGLSGSLRAELLLNRSNARLALYKKEKTNVGSPPEKLSSLLKSALKDGIKTIEHQPNSWEGYGCVGRVFRLMEEWELAIILLDKALALDPSITDLVETRILCKKILEKIQDQLDQCGTSREEKLDENRTAVVKKHRDDLLKWYRSSVQETMQISTTRPNLKQKAPSKLSNLKDILLNEMNADKETIYRGFVIGLTIVDDPIVCFSTLQTVVRDEKFNYQHCYFYNWGTEDLTKKFLYGTKLSIMNPYFWLPKDKSCGIRVDDPESVVVHGRDDAICRYCGAAGAPSRCSRCARAVYCNKQCQTLDWNLLKHKQVCQPNLLQKLEYVQSAHLFKKIFKNA